MLSVSDERKNWYGWTYSGQYDLLLVPCTPSPADARESLTDYFESWFETRGYDCQRLDIIDDIKKSSPAILEHIWVPDNLNYWREKDRFHRIVAEMRFLLEKTGKHLAEKDYPCIAFVADHDGVRLAVELARTLKKCSPRPRTFLGVKGDDKGDGFDLVKLEPGLFDFACLEERRIPLGKYFPIWGDFREPGVDSIAEEIRFRAREQGMTHFVFPEFMPNEIIGWLERFCQGIESLGIPIHWKAPIHIDPHTANFHFEMMRKTGCESLLYYADSLANPTLKLMRKPFLREDIEWLLKLSSEAGIRNEISLAVGFPEELDEAFHESLRALKLNESRIHAVFDLYTYFVPERSYLEDCPVRYGVFFPEKGARSRWHNSRHNVFSYRRKLMKETAIVLAKSGIECDEVARNFDPIFSKLSEKVYRRYLDEIFFPPDFVKANRSLVGILSRQNVFSGPTMLEMDLTNACNNSCIACWNYSPLLGDARIPLEKRKHHLSLREARELITEFARMGGMRMQFSGAGEPMMHPNLVEILALAKSLNLEATLVTSFTLATPEIVKALVDMGLDYMTVSVWAGTPETYVRTHPNQTPETFRRIRDNLRLLHSFKRQKNQWKPIVKIYNVICRENCHEIVKMTDFALDALVDSIEYQVVDVVPGKTDSLLLRPEDRQTIIQQAKALQKRAVIPGGGRIHPSYPIETYGVGDWEAERLDFGRFMKDTLPHGFQFTSAPMVEVECPRGKIGRKHECEHMLKSFEFDFSEHDCSPRDCELSPTCPIAEGRPIIQEFLSLKGFGSFLRRVTSSESSTGVYESSFVDSMPCYVGWTYLRVTSEGDVIPCCKAYSFPLGNIRKKPFRQIWTSKATRTFRTNALTLPKSDPFFSKIECQKACDNVGTNLETHRAIETLTAEQREILLGAAQTLKPLDATTRHTCQAGAKSGKEHW